MNPLISDEALQQLTESIEQSNHIIICAHRGPDGDAVGASLGWAEHLQSMGKDVQIVMPNPFPDFLRCIPNSHAVRFFARHEEEISQLIAQSDLIFCLDFNGLSRLQEMQQCVEQAQAPKIIIDHHLNPDTSVAKQVISFPEFCSTSEIIFRLILQMGGFEALSRNGAISIYTGMMTDTGGFTYNSNRPEVYETISMLLTKGFDKDKIYRNIFNVYSVDRMQFMGYILYRKLRFYADNRASIFTITRQEMRRFNFMRGDAEGLVNLPLQVKGMRLSISLREDTERDVVRVSLRSVDDFPCNLMAERFFNGGGHLNASGGELPFPLEAAVRTAEHAILAFEKQL